MAYADIGAHKLNPTALVAVFLINGLMAGAIILSVPSVTAAVFGPPIKVITIAQPPAPPPPPTPHRATKQANNVKTVITTPPIADQIDPVVDKGFTLPIGPDILTGPLGTDIGPLVTPPPPTPAVLKGAKLDPRFAGNLQPVYPLGMLRLNLEGSVTVRVLVGADGRVKQVEPIKVTEEDFLKATREQAFKKWRFLPATRDGAPVESWREMTVRFQMPIE